MATSDQVRRLIESHDRGDERSFRRVASDLTQSTREGQQDSLALNLERLAVAQQRPKPLSVGSLRPLPLGREDMPLVSLHDPKTSFADLVLTPDLMNLLEQVVNEQRHRDILLARGLHPRRRLLFTGPSGTGKTRTAEAIARELGVPIARVKLAAVVSSYLGETSRHLEQIMDYASHGTWVLVFDEIDMLGAERDRDDHSEMRRVVAAFLQSLEDADGDNIVVATTNHPGVLDAALWRRFDEVAVFHPPNKVQIERLLAVKLRKMRGRINRSVIAQSLSGMTHAEVEHVCLDAMRRATLEARSSLTTEDLLSSAAARRKRLQEAGQFLS